VTPTSQNPMISAVFRSLPCGSVYPVACIPNNRCSAVSKLRHLAFIGIGSRRVLQKSSIPASTIELENEAPRERRVADYPPHQPAVDRDRRAGHIAGKIGREELDDVGAILDRPAPPKADQFGPVAIALNAARNDRRHDPPRGDHAGRGSVCRHRMTRDPGSNRKALWQRPSYGDDLRGRLPSQDRDDRARFQSPGLRTERCSSGERVRDVGLADYRRVSEKCRGLPSRKPRPGESRGSPKRAIRVVVAATRKIEADLYRWSTAQPR
jgi:hypothetical protein